MRAKFSNVMQGTVCLLVIHIFLVSCAHDPQLPTADEAKAAVMEKITMASEKWSTGEPLGYVECAANDIVWVDQLGASTPIRGAEALKNYLESYRGQVPAHKFELLDPLFRVYGDIVIVNYRYQGIFDGVRPNPWKVTSVYRYENGDWLSVLEDWAEVKE